MFRRLLIATVVGILAAFAVAGFRHAMLLLEWLFLNNDSEPPRESWRLNFLRKR